MYYYYLGLAARLKETDNRTINMLDEIHQELREFSETQSSISWRWIREMNDWIWEFGRLRRANPFWKARPESHS
jgi:hypothetical protein